MRSCRLLHDYLPRPRGIFEIGIFGLGVEVEGTMRKGDSGYAFSEIVIRAKLTILGDEEQVRALRLLHKAKAACLVSRALSVEQTFEPQVLAGESRVEFSQASPVA